MRMYLAGEWVERAAKIAVLNPYDGSTVDSVPSASLDDVEKALASAEAGARAMASLTAHERYAVLHRAADLLVERSEEIAQTITLEEGKILAEARVEVQRAVQTITVSAEEAKRLYGETVPLDAAPSTMGQLGFTLRVPCGVVVAISPFNFPLNLVCHKVGPALAAGNAVIVKPASGTPLTALKLVEILLEAGLPPTGVQALTGPGGVIGDALCADPRVRKITFTGSQEVGEHICQVAGMKKITMELGSNCPLIVMPDADLEKVARATVASGYANAGQVCISTQRVLVAGAVYGDFLDALKPMVEGITTGNPMQESVRMGPLLTEGDAARIHEWVQEAVAGSARLVAGGEHTGTMYAPTIVADVAPDTRIFRDELFGPVVGVTRFESVDQAIALANDSRYGLSAGIFTQDVDSAMRFVREAESGNIHINGAPGWRADLMPYGGVKMSGMGKEGPRYAVQEMTELKMVVFHP
jgi:glyceraldehyde-3-phosphate dehydrogenase (NADP+)